VLRAGVVIAVATSALIAGSAAALVISSDSASHSVQTAVLADPAEVTASLGPCSRTGTEIRLTWTPTASRAADGYEIRRSQDGGATFTVVGLASPASASGYSDTTAKLERTYVYAVATTRALWRSPGAVTATITTPSKAVCR